VADGGQYQGDNSICEPDTCEPAIDPCGQPDAGNCCGTNFTPGCNDADCCDLVCSMAPFCCDVIWTGQCADLAFEFCSSCGPSQRTMIIKQGTCPAPVNLTSFGFVQTVLAGDTDFDVADVVLSSLQLRRCDGGGGSASPAAQLTHILDLNHPVAGVVTCSSCACDEDQSSDGIDDLVLKFATGAMSGFLSSEEGQVTLQLTGQLTDGSDFVARDCVTIVPPNNVVTANVDVQSNVNGTLIEVTPPDRNNDGGGFTNLGLAYTPNTEVTFTAPASQDGTPFSRWIVDGTPQLFGVRTILVPVTNQTVVRAVYGIRTRFQAGSPEASETD
jgi:hypothetical protein